MMTIALGITLMVIAICFYMMARNEWVLRLRMKVIDENIYAYYAMPTYDEMLWKYWWVWSAKYFYLK